MKKIENLSKTYFLYHGKLVEMIAHTTGSKVNIFQTVQEKDGKHCPHCEKPIGPEVFHEVESSMNFQSGAEPINTLLTPTNHENQ